MKKELSHVFRFNMIYQLILALGSIIVSIIYLVPAILKENNISDEKITTLFTGKMGLISLFSLFIAFAFVLLARRKKLWKEDLANFCKPHQAMKGNILIICAMLLFSEQLIYMIIAPSVEWLANQFGYTMQPYLEQSALNENSWSMLIYTNFLGPVIEEIVFRGVILHRLLRYGRVFAMIFSSLLFGLFHGELTQGIFAFCCGLIFSYITIFYSIKWAFLLHIFNNLVISTMLGSAIALLPKNLVTPVTWLIIISLGVLGLLLLWCSKKKVLDNLKEKQPVQGVYRKAVTSLWFILTILWSIYNFIDIFEKR